MKQIWQPESNSKMNSKFSEENRFLLQRAFYYNLINQHFIYNQKNHHQSIFASQFFSAKHQRRL